MINTVSILGFGDASTGQVIIAVGIILSVLALAVAQRLRLRDEGLTAEARRHRDKLTQQIASEDPREFRVPITDDIEGYREEVRALFAEDAPEHGKATTFRRAVRGTVAQIDAPNLAVRGFFEAVVLLLSAALVTVPVAWWRSALGGERTLDVVAYLSALAEGSGAVAEAANLALSFGLVAVTLVYSFWLPLAVTLAVLSVLFALVDKYDLRGERFARGALKVLFFVALPVTVVYFGQALLSAGKVYEVGALLWTAPITTKVAAGVFVALLFITYYLSSIRVSDAFRESLTRTTVRTALFARGLPLTVMFFSALFLLNFGLVWWQLLAAILGVGVAVRVMSGLYTRAKYKTGGSGGESAPSRVFVEAWRLEDANGDTRLYARLNGHEVAHDTVEGMTDEILDRCREAFEDGEIRPSLGSMYAESMTEYGIVGRERVRAKVRRKIRRDVRGNIREKNGIRKEVLDEALLEKYPENVYDEMMSYLRRKGEIDERGGRYVMQG